MSESISRRAVCTIARGVRCIRRALLASGFNAAAAAVVFPAVLGARAAIPMMVYKDPNCGCCKSWVSLMRSAGFEISVRDTSDIQSIKRRYQVPAALASCHTALVGGYVVEGHVPADLISRLLKEEAQHLSRSKSFEEVRSRKR